MNTFHFNGRATVKHLNPRKEGPDDEKTLALDVKLQGKVPASLWDYFHEGLRPVLYTDLGAARNLLMESIGFNNEVKNCTVTILGRDFLGVTVGKFKLKPIDTWRIELTFSITVQPSGTEVAEFAEYLQDEVDVFSTPAPDLFNQGATESSPAERLSDDELLYEARRVVIESGRASVSFIQRQLSIGYNRAAQLLEDLEAQGVVSAMGPKGERQVLMSLETNGG